MTRILLEACVQSVDGAIAAEKGGADRIELNTALRLGGLTPSPGLLREVLQHLSIPVIAMLRPREGDFCYSSQEFRVMLQDADMLLDAGVHGIAFGILSPDRTIDRDRSAKLMKAIGTHAETVFHRAFDHTSDAMDSFERLKDLGVTRVLTSGLAPTAIDGSACLAQLVAASNAQTRIIAAGSIRPHNVRELLQATGVEQVHAALTSINGMMHNPGQARSIALGTSDDGGFLQTDETLVREMRSALDQMHTT